MGLSNASTDQAVWNAYDDNASYDSNASSSQAYAFVAACRILMRRLPQMMSQQGGNVRMNPDLIQKEMDKATQWIASNPDSSVKPGGVGYFGFNFIR